jgi:hypothetical protein
MPSGSPRMLLLNWLDELLLVLLVVLVLVELVFLPKSDFSRLVPPFVLVLLLVSADAAVVKASPAQAVWSGVAMQSTAARSSAAFLESDGRECMARVRM